ncbi:MAG: radical SAM protein [Oscillospiraceae bacterium]|nr:radical SAM protein [Oscillospiraceae bacterium]
MPQDVHTYFQNKARENDALFQVEIDVTNQCNANCPFCFQGDHRTCADGELSLQQMIQLLDELREMGTFYIGFSGGEPFARKDFLEILREAKKRHFRVSLITNAMLLTKEKIDALADMNIDHINVSFHSVVLETYLKCFGIQEKNCYYKALENIQYMLQKNLSVGIAITVTKYNVEDIPATTKFFTDLGVKERDFGYNLLAKGRREINDLVPSKEQIAKNNAILTKSVDPQREESLICTAGTISCSIDAYGNVYPCTFFNTPAGNIHETPFQNIWKQSHLFKLIRSFQDSMFEKCSSCEIKKYCHICLVSNMNETGNVFKPSDIYCISRKARYGSCAQ